MRWPGRGSRSPRRRSGKSWTSAIDRAKCATSCRPISTSTTREGSAIFPARRFTFSPPSCQRPRTRSSLNEQSRYRRAQIAAVKTWAAVEEEGESWFGFSAVRAIPGTRDEVLLVPLPGHTRGHCGVAVKRQDDWLLHCGDAYFHHSELEKDGGAAPKGLRWLESLPERRRRATARQSGALARARARLRRRGQAHLLARSHRPGGYAQRCSAKLESAAPTRRYAMAARPRRCPRGRVRGKSVRPWRLAPQRLDRAAARLLVDPAHAGGPGGPCGQTAFWLDLRLDQQIGQSRSRIFAIARLAREALGENDDHAVLGGARRRQA